jgi:putative transposase
MLMYKAFQFRMYPNKEQAVLFAKTFGCVRKVYNLMLADKIKYYEQAQKMLRVTPAMYKLQYPYLTEVDSLALANAQLNLETAYKNFLGNPDIGFPKFKCKHQDRNSYTTNYVNNNIRLDNQYIVLPKVGRVRIKRHRGIPEYYKLKSCTISQEASGKYFVSVLYEYNENIEPIKIINVIGLDFSMKELYISSDGQHGDYPRYYRRAQEKLARMQKALSNMKKYSKNYYKQQRKIATLHAHIAHQRKDFLHKQSRQITNAYDCVAIESLNMKAMQQALNFGKSVNDNGWGMFTRFLGYKLDEQGKRLIKIDKWFPSSKTCSVCGAKKSELALSERTYFCGCGNVLDRDINAAINIKNEALRMLKSA